MSIVVAASENGVIGREGGLPWHLPADLAHFKKLTIGHPIIMGRKTFESIGRPLPGRQNIVITHDQNYRADGIYVADSLPAALRIAKSDDVYVIGGESIFDEALKITDRVYLTRVKAHVDGDKYFNFSTEGWRRASSEKHQADERNQYDFEFQEWVRQ